MFTVKINTFTYTLEPNKDTQYAKITEAKGDGSRAYIPDTVEYEGKSYLIDSIGKKAFMGLKNLKEVSLPGTVKVLEDWCFAQCTHLSHFAIRQFPEEKWQDENNISFERGVFEGCNSMESICLGYEEVDDKALLLGAATYRLSAPYLFQDPELGKMPWFENWDKSLLQFLNSKDDEGSADRVLCGEEDISYDGIGSVDGELLSDGMDYVEETIMRKCYLCFLRLHASENLKVEYQEQFVAYLRERGKGSQTELAWKVLKDSFGDKIEYFKLYQDYGLLEIEKIDEMLEDMGEMYAEAKAFLIGLKQESSDPSNFFDALLL